MQTETGLTIALCSTTVIAIVVTVIAARHRSAKERLHKTLDALNTAYRELRDECDELESDRSDALSLTEHLHQEVGAIEGRYQGLMEQFDRRTELLKEVNEVMQLAKEKIEDQSLQIREMHAEAVRYAGLLQDSEEKVEEFETAFREIMGFTNAVCEEVVEEEGLCERYQCEGSCDECPFNDPDLVEEDQDILQIVIDSLEDCGFSNYTIREM